MRRDRLEINPQNRATRSDPGGGDLQPRTGSRTTIDDSITFPENSTLIVNLDQFVSCPGTVRFSLGLAEKVIMELLHGKSVFD